jgi:SHS2 domain-containing protein
MCEPMRFEQFEHTADVGIKAYGKTLKELFGNAALGMFSIMVDLDGVASKGEFKVVMKSDDKEKLLVDWLGELLYIHEVYDVLLKDFEVDFNEAKEGEEGTVFELKAVVKGETIDREKHDLKSMIKAVTYHMLEINEDEGYLKVLFDI